MLTTATRTLAATGAAAALMLALVACGPQADENGDATVETQSPTPTETPTPTAEPTVFTQPRDCASILPQSRLDTFASQDLVLLGGPGGKFGDDYLAEPTPEQIAGGITCIWGDNSNDVSSLTVSVAPLSPATRPGVVSDLTNQGLNVEMEGNLTRYGLLGDEESDPAILNVLRPDSWISVISTFGGQIFFDEAVILTDEAAQVVYTAG